MPSSPMRSGPALQRRCAGSARSPSASSGPIPRWSSARSAKDLPAGCCADRSAKAPRANLRRSNCSSTIRFRPGGSDRPSRSCPIQIARPAAGRGLLARVDRRSLDRCSAQPPVDRRRASCGRRWRNGRLVEPNDNVQRPVRRGASQRIIDLAPVAGPQDNPSWSFRADLSANLGSGEGRNPVGKAFRVSRNLVVTGAGLRPSPERTKWRQMGPMGIAFPCAVISRSRLPCGRILSGADQGMAGGDSDGGSRDIVVLRLSAGDDALRSKRWRFTHPASD